VNKEAQQPKEIHADQLLIAQYETNGSLRHSLYCLSNGVAYKYHFTAGGWVKIPMVEAIAVPGRKHGRYSGPGMGGYYQDDPDLNDDLNP
jgi:hypothetical protein